MKNTTRRMFLRGAGAFALSIPFLPSLAGRASAATAPVKRLIGLYIPYGTVRTHWFPSDAKRVLEKVSGRASTMRLSDIEGDLSPVFQRATFDDALLSKMILLDGIDGPYGIGHQKTYPFTGYVTEDPSGLPGMSIDQVIAERAPIYDAEPAFRSLNFAAGPEGNTHGGTSVSYSLSGSTVVPVPQITNPAVAWDYAFKNVATGDDAELAFEEMKARKMSIIDHVRVDYERLRSHPNLSRADQLRMESYLQYLREFELSVEAMQPVTCVVPQRPEDLDKQPQDERIAAHIANIVHVVRCGLTNVITFNMESTSMQYSFLGSLTSHHHSMTHLKESNPDAIASLEKVDRFHAERVASLVKQLDVVEDPETGRTFLDNSLVCLTSDMGSVANHRGARLPCLMFGGKGYLKQNLLVDYRSDHQIVYGDLDPPKSERAGVSYNNALITACHALGLTPEEYEQGQAGIGNYYVSPADTKAFGGDSAAFESYAFGDKRTPLTELLEDG